ncbi:hypothetical protein Syun_002807 [Stephania yunnanensis]|uniref:Uncharacterized protein n=1 Tax=Stephania yunnanensis TaxID=152371 RepID=A0AAP0Q018_9MAGN
MIRIGLPRDSCCTNLEDTKYLIPFAFKSVETKKKRKKEKKKSELERKEKRDDRKKKKKKREGEREAGKRD